MYLNIIINKLMDLIYSPISRHLIYNYNHYIIFIIHDLSSFLTLLLFIILWNIKKNKIHKFIGFFSVIPLFITILSGFTLIKHQLNNNNNLIEYKFYSITLFTQGTNFITISSNIFLLKYLLKIQSKYPLYFLYFIHCYDLYNGIKSFLFLFYNIFYSNKYEYKLLSLELLIILTIPQLLIEIYYFYIHYKYLIKNYLNFHWVNHHKLSIIFLIYMSLPSIIFSIVHDKYWFNINEYLTNYNCQILFMILFLYGFIFFNRLIFKIPFLLK